MDPIRLNDVVVRVVAWHNRHPLARRIGTAQVHSVGEVVIPYRARAAAQPAADAVARAPAGTGLAGLVDALRALARRLRPGPPLQAAFSDAFIEALSPRSVASWVRRHGHPTPIAPDDWPCRVVATDELLAARRQARGLTVAIDLHVLTAAVAIDGRRLRLLLDERGVIFGHRAYSRPRLLGLAAMFVAAGCAAAFGSGLMPLPTIDLDAVARRTYAALTPAAPASGAIATLPEEAAAPPAAEPVAVEERTEPVEARPESPPALEPAAAPALSGPADQPADKHPDNVPAPPPAEDPPVEPPVPREANPPVPDPIASRQIRHDNRQSVARVNIRPLLSDDERRVAREDGERMRAAHSPAVPPSASKAIAVTAPRRSPVYALVAPPTRRRDESLALLARADLLRAMNAAPPRRDVIEAKGMWRAAFWPFETLADAERARVVLAGKGLKAEVVEF